jgi:hypothetical protein
LIDVHATAQDIENVLESLSNIGDVAVTLQTDTSLLQNNKTYLITFTTLGNPSNDGALSTLMVHYITPQDGKFQIITHVEQDACCEVRVTYNGGHEWARSSKGIIMDEHSKILNITPTTGSINGGELITLYGSGFLVDDIHAKCLFGSISTSALVHDTSTASCITPPHPAARVSVTLQFSSVDVGSVSNNQAISTSSVSSTTYGAISRSTSLFIYESALFAEYVVPRNGQVNEITLATVKVSDKTPIIMDDPVYCEWNVTFTHSAIGNYPPRITVIEATRVNSSFITCETPNDVTHGFVNEDNDDWYLDSNATATLRLTKNEQSYSNELPFFFYSRPALHSIYPNLASVNGNSNIVLTGSNFVISNEATCQIGPHIVPALVTSSSKATCVTRRVDLKPPVHQIRVLGP